MNRHFIPLALLSSLLGLCSGCQSFNSRVFRFEKVTSDGVEVVAQSFRAYYHSKTNGASPAQIQKLDGQLRSVGIQRMNVNVALDVVDTLRLAYKTNQSNSTYTNVLNGMTIANSAASNVVWVVNFFKTQTN